MRAFFLVVVSALLVSLPGSTGRALATERGARLVDDVQRRVARSFWNRRRARERWSDELVARYRAQALAAPDEVGDLAAVNALLRKLGSSHCELLRRSVYEQQFRSESHGRETVRFGLELARRELPGGGSGWFAIEVLPGSAADRVGLRRGDEIVAVDGVAPGRSPRTAIFGDRGIATAPGRLLLGEAPVSLRVRTRPEAAPVPVRLVPGAWSRIDASGASAHVERRLGRRIGVLRLYHVLHPDILTVVEEALEGPLRDVDGLVLDLRGWGGRVDVLSRLLSWLPGGRRERVDGPLVCLVDERTRSAKEVGAYHLSRRGIPLVGRRTAGAVLGCRFFPVGEDHVLMLPVQDVRRLSGGVRLEGKGVAPGVEVADDLPYAAGRDAVFDAGMAKLLERLAKQRQRTAAF